MFGSKADSQIVEKQVGSNYTILCPHCSVPVSKFESIHAVDPKEFKPRESKSKPVTQVVQLAPPVAQTFESEVLAKHGFSCNACKKSFYMNLLLVNVRGFHTLRVAFSF